MRRVVPWLAVLTVACGSNKGATPTAQATMLDSADQVAFGLQHSLVEGGIKKAALRADTAFVYDNQSKFDMHGGVQLIMFDSLGAPVATLTSKKATYSTARKSMEARGDVVVTTTDGKRLDTQHLIYDQLTNKIRSDSAFVIVEPTRRMEGASFISDPKMEVMSCVASPTRNCVYTGVAPPPRDTSTTVNPVPTVDPLTGRTRVDTLAPPRSGTRHHD